MRILHIVTMLEQGGAQFNTILSTEESLRRGHDAWMIASPGELSDEARRRLGESYIELGSILDTGKIPGVAPGLGTPLTMRTSLMRREVRPGADFSAYATLSRLIRLLRPDIVHTHSSKAGILGRWAAHHCRVPVVIHTAHGWGFHDFQRPLAKRIFSGVERAAARITDRIVVVADDNREKALREGIGRAEQYVTIRSGIDERIGELARDRDEKRRRLGLSDDAVLVSWVGNFKPQKAPLDMARLARALVRARPDIHFLALGDGALRSEVEDILEGSERVRLLGWRKDSAAIIAASDILAHTAIFEGLPRVILEAMASGVPVVSTDVDGIPEAVRSGETGFLRKPGEWEALSRDVLRLADDNLLRRRFSSAAREAFRSEFTLSKMFDDLEELYREELARKTRG